MQINDGQGTINQWSSHGSATQSSSASPAGSIQSQQQAPEFSTAQSGGLSFQDGIAGKSANAKLEDIWSSVAGGTEASQPAQAPQNTLAMNTFDNIDNRELKAEYSGIDDMLNNLAADESEEEERSVKDGMVTVRATSENGERVWSYPENNPRQITYQKNGATYKRDAGGSISYTRGPVSYSYSVDEKGGLTKETVKNGEKSSKIAGADGSYTEKNGAGEVTRSSGADPEMAGYDELASKMGHSVGADGKEAPLSDRERYALTTCIGRFDMGMLQKLDEAGVTFNLYDHQNAPAGGYPGDNKTSWPTDENGEQAQAFYNYKDNIVALKKADFQAGGNIPGLEATHHEIGHAIDDYLDGIENETGTVDTDPAYQKLYDNHQKDVAADSNRLWNRNSNEDKWEYFADGIRAFTSDAKTKQMFMETDPAFYGQIEKILTGAA